MNTLSQIRDTLWHDKSLPFWRDFPAPRAEYFPQADSFIFYSLDFETVKRFQNYFRENVCTFANIMRYHNVRPIFSESDYR